MNTYAVYETNADIISIFVNTVDKGLISWNHQDPEAVAYDIASILGNAEQRSTLYDYETEGDDAAADLELMEQHCRLLSADGNHATPDMSQATAGDIALAHLRARLEDDGAEQLLLEQETGYAIEETLRIFRSEDITICEASEEAATCRGLIAHAAQLEENWHNFAELVEAIGTHFDYITEAYVNTDENEEPEEFVVYTTRKGVNIFSDLLLSAIDGLEFSEQDDRAIFLKITK